MKQIGLAVLSCLVLATVLTGCGGVLRAVEGKAAGEPAAAEESRPAEAGPAEAAAADSLPKEAAEPAQAYALYGLGFTVPPALPLVLEEEDRLGFTDGRRQFVASVSQTSRVVPQDELVSVMVSGYRLSEDVLDVSEPEEAGLNGDTWHVARRMRRRPPTALTRRAGSNI